MSLARAARWLLLAIAWSALAPTAPAEQASAALELVPSETCRGLFIVPVQFEGGAMELVLDTGAAFSVVDPDAVRRVFGRSVRAGKRVKLRRAEAGPLKLRRFSAKVHELDHVGRFLGRDIDGILGMDTFAELLLTLDYPAGEVRVGRGRLPAPDGVTVFRDLGTGRRPFIAMELEGARRPVLIDSGFSGALDVRDGDASQWRTSPRVVSATARFEGVELSRAGRLEAGLRLGPLSLESPVVGVVDGTRKVGARILERCVLTFDRAGRRIRIEVGSSEPIRLPPVLGVGVAFRPGEEGFLVARLLEDSAAAQAGIRVGDVVVAVDGTPIHERGCVSMAGTTTAQPVAYTLRREGETLTLVVTPSVLVP